MSGSATGRLVSRSRFVRILEIPVAGVGMKSSRRRMLMCGYWSTWTQRSIIRIRGSDFGYILFIAIGSVDVSWL